jgi:hypothetical protein
MCNAWGAKYNMMLDQEHLNRWGWGHPSGKGRGAGAHPSSATLVRVEKQGRQRCFNNGSDFWWAVVTGEGSYNAGKLRRGGEEARPINQKWIGGGAHWRGVVATTAAPNPVMVTVSFGASADNRPWGGLEGGLSVFLWREAAQRRSSLCGGTGSLLKQRAASRVSEWRGGGSGPVTCITQRGGPWPRLASCIGRSWPEHGSYGRWW